MDSTQIISFQQAVWEYYSAHARHDLPWRWPEPDGHFDPYKILVSEMMLQQTQVSRVAPKYLAFVQAFPTFQALADASLSDVLRLWSGLGYNRRAKFLWQTAQLVSEKHGGNLPRSRSDLVALPGIGANTAGAILAYAYNMPELFIETNIRTVYFHHFFADQTDIPDSALAPLTLQSLPKDEPRLWYWALMDYGTHLKQAVGNLSRASKGYARQSTFAGSRRQIRGQVLKLLATAPRTLDMLRAHITDERLEAVLDDLIKEHFIEFIDAHYRLRS